MSQDTIIQYPDKKDGVIARGPLLVGRKYSVPADVAKHLIDQGAEVATLAPASKDKPAETATPLERRHYEHFDDVRAILKEAGAAKPTPAPAEAAAQPGDVK